MAHESQTFIDGWQTYSNWLDSLKDESKVIDNYSTCPKFRQALCYCPENKQRFALFWNEETNLKNEIEHMYKQQSESFSSDYKNNVYGKSAEKSIKFRELGNKHYKQRDFEQALSYYTEAISTGPYPINVSTEQALDSSKGDFVAQEFQDNSLALAFANRSAVLYEVSKYKLCLIDIDFAIKFGYPKKNMAKLIIRKIKSLHILSIWDSEGETLKADLSDCLEDPSTSEATKNEIKGMFEFIQQTIPEDFDKDESDMMDYSDYKLTNINKRMPHVSDYLEMNYSDEKGRHMIASNNIPIGKLLMVDEPFVCNLAPVFWKVYCYNCYAYLHGCGIGCLYCSQVLFCSVDCRDSHNIHKAECNKLLSLQNLLGVAYIIIHILIKNDFNFKTTAFTDKHLKVTEKPLEEIIQFDIADWPEQHYKSDYASLLSLLDHAEDYDTDDMFSFVLTSVYIMIAIKDLLGIKTYEQYVSNLEDEIKLGTLILRHLLQLQTNLISILYQNRNSTVSTDLNTIFSIKETPIGIGLYPTVSLLNHSCNPNICSIFYRNRFIVKNSKRIEDGIEISYCYGPSVTRMSKKDRQKRLEEQYFFDCNCESCTNNVENEGNGLRCHHCNKGSVIYNSDYSHECMNCHTKDFMDVKTIVMKVEKLRLEFQSLENDVIDPSIKIDRISKLESELYQLVYWKNPVFSTINASFVNSAVEMEDYEKAQEFCDKELLHYKRLYGPESLETTCLRIRHIDFRWRRAYQIIEDTPKSAKIDALIHLQPVLEDINDIRRKLRELLASTNILGAEETYRLEMKFLNDTQDAIKRYRSSIDGASE